MNIGNPAIWWAFIPAIIVALLVLLLKRDWRFGALLVVFGAGYFPWFMYPNRTMFYFYALSFEPFLILLLAGVLGLALSGARGSVLPCPFGRDAGGDLPCGCAGVECILYAAVDCSGNSV